MNSNTEIISAMSPLGYATFSEEETGLFFEDDGANTCIIIDTNICNLDGYYYVDYTSRQNHLVHQYNRVFRFLFNGDNSIDDLKSEIEFFLNDDEDPEQLQRFGRNRSEQDIDPSQPEAVFEEYFIDAFGYGKLNVLHKEFAYFDRSCKSRFIDYALFSNIQKFAVELNGEAFHHPAVIGPKKYRSQLFKQNSLSSDGFKVFRWSLRGMQDREKFIQELRFFFGDSSCFLSKPSLKIERQIKTFELYEHQEDTLKRLKEERSRGRGTFLIVLPTGTGKTEIFIEDINRLKTEMPDLSALIIVPTRKLRDQTIERFQQRGPVLKCSRNLFLTKTHDITVLTSAYLQRHYFKVDSSKFDYVVVDEAHHAPAVGLRRVLEHFAPLHLIGLTATPDRLDQQRLEDIFGEYESMLTIEEAIVEGLIPPIRCFRIKSNIDLSEVRFNGKEYVKSDLQKKFVVTSRDELIAKTLVKYFSGPLKNKQGIVFCVDIKHTERMAVVLEKYGIPAKPVSGKDTASSKKALSEYKNGNVRFLCACDLLTEGWDAPQTCIIVMARPTFSRVLYTQQLGRGTRTYLGKEALYVLDVVDAYGARLQPLSLHSLFGIGQYKPFEDVIKTKYIGAQDELIFLNGLFENVRRIEPVNIFNYEEVYGNYLNEEQMARELFVDTNTVKAWLKKGEISSDIQYPFGRNQLHFFDPNQVDKIRKKKGLKTHTEETRKDDFFEFLDKRDYTYTYKIIFLLSFLKFMNDRGESNLQRMLEIYKNFYCNLLAKYGRSEKDSSPYNNTAFVEDDAKMQRSLLGNPFEKFERKRFFHHCKDLNYLSLDTVLHDQFEEKDYDRIRTQMVQDLKDYYKKQNISITQEDHFFLLSKEESEVDQADIVFLAFPAEEKKFSTVLPFYPLSIAAGEFNKSETPPTPGLWIDMHNLSSSKKFDHSMFISRINGQSMEPTIKDGSYCLFTRNVLGSRIGRIVLAQKLGLEDTDTGASYTIKRYYSSKVIDEDTGWKHERIVLKADNYEYNDIEIIPTEADDFSIIAFLIEVLG